MMLAACGSTVGVGSSSGGGSPAEGGSTTTTPGSGGANGVPDKEALWRERCDACFGAAEDKITCLMRPQGWRCHFEWSSTEAIEAKIACCKSETDSDCEDEWSNLPKTDAYLAFREACLESACNVALQCSEWDGYSDEVYEKWTPCIQESPCAYVGACFDCPYDDDDG